MNKPHDILPWEDIIVTIDPPEDTTEQGVIIGVAKSDEEKGRTPEKGIVISVGRISEGKKLPIALKPGDMIFYERYTANKIPYAGKEYNFVRTKFVMGVVPQ